MENEPQEPRLIGDTPIEDDNVVDGIRRIELANIRPLGIVEPNSELAMSIARRIREERSFGNFTLRKQTWKDRSFIPGDF